MKQLELKGTARKTGKKADVKSVRKDAKVPCVVYGNGTENISFSVEANDLKQLTHTPYSHIVKLNIDGKEQLAILHEVQYHPITDAAIHADFLAVSEDKPVTISVPVRFTGNSEGVKSGGKFEASVRKLRICGLIANLPDELTIDITPLKIGKQISAGDLSYDNIKIVNNKTTLICAVKMTRAAAAEATAAAE